MHACCRVTHGRFMDSARKFKAGRPVLEYLRTLPVDKHDARLYTMAFSALAAARDLDSATAALDLAKRQDMLIDKHLLTAFMKGASRPPACTCSAGSACSSAPNRWGRRISPSPPA